jgi:hypothetical protein
VFSRAKISRYVQAQTFRQRNGLFHFSLSIAPKEYSHSRSASAESAIHDRSQFEPAPLNEPTRPASQRDNRSLPGKRE